MSLVANGKFGVVEKNIKNRKCFPPKNFQWYPASQASVPWFIPSDHVPTFETDTFAFIDTLPRHMEGKHWLMIAKFCQEMLFAEPLGREKSRFFKQNYR